MPYKKLLTTIYLIIVLALSYSAFSINYSVSSLGKIFLSYDEMVYWQLGHNLKNSLDYTSAPTADFLRKRAGVTEFPAYFTAPLFKHPPFYPFLVSVSMRLFGESFVSVRYPSALAGALLILLTYLLAKGLIGKHAALLCSFMVFLDPVINICSQKVWMDSTLAFLTLLAVFFFVKALRTGGGIFFVLAGFVVGLALNTKYPGGLILVAFLLWALFYERQLFKNRFFWVTLLLPLMMLLPWLWCNYRVYGASAMAGHEELKRFLQQISPFLVSALIAVALMAYVFFFLKRMGFLEPLKQKGREILQNKNFQWVFKGVLAAVLLIVLGKYFLRGLDPFHDPKISVASGGAFHDAPFFFYFGRLLEYSVLYGLAYMAFFLGWHKRDIEFLPLIKICSAVILLFFVAWGSYQCRYIVATLPFLIILGVAAWNKVMVDINGLSSAGALFISRTGWRLFLIYIILRTIYFNYHFTYYKNICYF